MKFTIIIFVSAVLLTACQSNNDPFKRVPLGQEAKVAFFKRMMDSKILSDPDKDSSDYRYTIRDKSFSFPCYVNANPDEYKFGKLKQLEQLEVNLCGDSVYEAFGTEMKPPMFQRGGGPRRKKEVDKVFDLYKKWYGKPDSIHYGRDSRNIGTEIKWIMDSISTRGLTRPKTEKKSPLSDSLNFLGGDVVWKQSNRLVIFVLPPPYKEKYFKMDSAYSKVKIIYQNTDFQKTVATIRDSVRKTLKPNNIVTVDISKPKWTALTSQSYSDYDYQLAVEWYFPKRIDREEPKAVTAIRFDIILSDKFGEELCRLPDQTYECKEPLRQDAFRFGSMISGIKYHISSEKSIPFEKARRYSENNSIVCRADIKSIVFDDGTVLK